MSSNFSSKVSKQIVYNVGAAHMVLNTKYVKAAAGHGACEWSSGSARRIIFELISVLLVEFWTLTEI
jgi:hypothetical protein